MKKISLALLAGASLFAAASCSDMLNIEQHGVNSVENFYKTDADFISAGATLYNDLRSQYTNGIMVKCAIDDDFYAGGGGRGDNSQVEYLDEFTYDAEHGSISGYFQGLYTIIYDANVILEKIDPNASATAKMVYNEAKVFRAYAFFELTTLWGNVPFVDHVLNPEEYQIANGKPEQLWGLIENDLNEAIASGALSQKSSATDASSWRMTKQAAQALLGKAYLFQGKNAEAAKVLDEVITSGKYSLMSEYGEFLDVNNRFNSESVIEFEYPTDPANSNFGFLHGMAAWRMSKMKNVPAEYAPDGYGFYTPSKSLYDAFVAVEGADGYRLNHSVKTAKQMQDELGIEFTEPHYANEGYFMWKNRLKANQILFGMPWFTVRNVIIMRYSEVLLLAAEANITVDPAKAVKYFNEVRTRAQAPTVSSLDLKTLQNEKRIELCYEGTRWQDIVRWGIAYDCLKDKGDKYPMLQLDRTITWNNTNNPEFGFKKGKHELLPIPAAEMRVNNVIEQNPGW